MKQLESLQQQTVIQWWRIACNRYHLPENVLFAVPNGGMRSVKTAARLKAEGVRAGIPDLVLAVPRDPYHGLFIEMKQGKGRLSPAQAATLSILEQQGYATVVPYGFEAAQMAITDYLEGFFTGRPATGPKSKSNRRCKNATAEVQQ